MRFSGIIDVKGWLNYKELLGKRFYFSNDEEQITERPEECLVDTLYDWKWCPGLTKFYPSCERGNIDYDSNGWGLVDDNRKHYTFIRFYEE